MAAALTRAPQGGHRPSVVLLHRQQLCAPFAPPRAAPRQRRDWPTTRAQRLSAGTSGDFHRNGGTGVMADDGRVRNVERREESMRGFRPIFDSRPHLVVTDRNRRNRPCPSRWRGSAGQGSAAPRGIHPKSAASGAATTPARRCPRLLRESVLIWWRRTTARPAAFLAFYTRFRGSRDRAAPGRPCWADACLLRNIRSW